ncbi:MAG: imidazole glycerol phosphate synthase subunit HisH [Candidatus Thermoplasmatota archaeon]|nr:imidazole glycerol phosphate synthase subunit HisH [Candidatus Thermoplasmatota archaeon]
MISKNRKSSIAIIDLNVGNLFSIKNACDYCGLNSFISSSPDCISQSDAIIIPGMGAFGDAMNVIESSELWDIIKEFNLANKPILGICLGMQILMTYGTEFGYYKGLGFIDGSVNRFQKPMLGNTSLKVPHIGWNKVIRRTMCSEKSKEYILENLPMDVFMYFNHSYYVVPDSSNVVIATTSYGDITFSSIIKKKHIIGVQFHPERSGKAGLALLQNFARMIE